MRVLDLILHMVMPFQHWEMTVRIGFAHRIPVFKVFLDAAERKICMPLQFLRQRQERFVPQTCFELAA